MCKFTIYNLECGHPGEDHVSGKDCPHFKETGVPCDRENPANRNRVNLNSEDRDGICNKCRRRQREMEQLDAMRRDEERAKQQSLAESQEREAAAKAHEERLYKESRDEYERLRREREQADLEFMLQKSREEAEAARLQNEKEQEDLAKALKASCVLEPADRNVTVEVKVSA
jgi:enabled protein